jgi:Lectin C-type domain
MKYYKQIHSLVICFLITAVVGWDSSPFGKEYYFHQTESDYDRAWSTCLSLNATLVIIQNSTVQDYLFYKYGCNGFWTAATFSKDLNKFVWFNGEPLWNVNWEPGKSDKKAFSRVAVKVTKRNEWQDAFYHDNAFVLCERQPQFIKQTC